MLEPYYDHAGITIYCGDCREVMQAMPAASVTAVVTDPPYGLSFMGKKWDYDVPTVELWAECLRVLKPGGHLLAFAGTRTQHRMAVRIEDAGFEIRDMIAWVYGSGFPKSLNVSKAIDRAAGELKPEGKGFTVAGSSHRLDLQQGRRSPSRGYVPPTPATPEAQQWAGWGTALKPAWESIILARKPLVGTVAANCLEHGTGALNIDGCRVGTDESTQRPCGPDSDHAGQFTGTQGGMRGAEAGKGRWPANLIHDGSDEVLAGFPNVKAGVAVRSKSGGNTFGGNNPKPPMDDLGYGDSGSAARFFYCAKASKADRSEGNIHPTVKPTDLMRYLCRLVTPPGGIVLDPFCGSGSTLVAAQSLGRRAIGIEIEERYAEIAAKRLAQEVLPFGP